MDNFKYSKNILLINLTITADINNSIYIHMPTNENCLSIPSTPSTRIPSKCAISCSL